MRILFCSSWPLDDGLTRSTVEPAIAALRRLPTVQAVALHAPRSRRVGGIRGRLDGLRADLAAARAAMGAHRPDVIIARGIPAGNIAERLARSTGTALVVESFEPHARYMAEAGAWSRWGPKYCVQSALERRQRRTAAHLVCVAERFRDELIAQGCRPSEVTTMPCLVDAAAFAPDGGRRKEVRSSLGLDDDAIVLVHLGKFGGVYHDDAAFAAFAAFVAHVGSRAFVMVLTPQDADGVRSKASAAGVPAPRLWVRSVAHTDVPRHLAAADLALNTWRPIPSSYACSPVKDAEYWASGLPVLMSSNIGDDARLVARHRLGWSGDLTDPQELRAGFDSALAIASEPDARRRIARFARDHRDFDRLGPHYEQVLASLG